MATVYCSENDWFYKTNFRQNSWTMTPSSEYRYHECMMNEGEVNCFYVATNISNVNPVVYLKSNIQIKGGSGSSADPYTLDY